MLTKMTFNDSATSLFKTTGEDKVRLKFEDDGIVSIRLSHRPHRVKNECLSHVRYSNGQANVAFRGSILLEGTYMMIPSKYGWYNLIPGIADDNFGIVISYEFMKNHEAEVYEVEDHA